MIAKTRLTSVTMESDVVGISASDRNTTHDGYVLRSSKITRRIDQTCSSVASSPSAFVATIPALSHRSRSPGATYGG